MRALTYNVNQDQFELNDLPIPDPKDNEVLVKVQACALNPIDSKIFNWHTLVPNMGTDFIVGLDVVGQITKLGSSVSQYKVGDQVLFHGDMLSKHGGLAEYTIQPATAMLHLPSNIPVSVAASSPCTGWTAWRALVDRLKIQDKESIFISGASGGVGSFAVQIAKYFGVKNIIASCSASHMDYVKCLGASSVIDYNTQDVVGQVDSLTDHQGVDVALDCVGKKSEIQCANVLKYEGALVSLVEVANLRNYNDAKARGLTVHQLSLGAGYRNDSKGLDTIFEAGRAVTNLLVKGKLKAPPLSEITLEQAADVLLRMRKHGTNLKTVVVF